MGNYHVPFWRAVEEVTPSLTLIIIRKVATLGISLARVGRAALNLPKRYNVFKGLSKLYRELAQVCLQTT